ncbi:bifunctional glutamate N-acetyltransferase/amino-acid acetyltransferase ArgJ [Allostreptomyces psammosilenae]|uniref:Arginine biosynthesis bifunctional protein ArgJ n=1 Tax=Allostreptomyces psammosilenae TaxID=1892865 RepID=A0A853ABL2_9ACTN|nr:bifunctional glutamate N-acetyltransferase/amino-acid acetyltransferase ArgJ [Allostreptomyces psammosilenae]NYI07762.1 glutamate N-acetyltransferase/amino-acid N-acetyltransferase [Allostreptomyces psammosilenae]
MTEHGGWPIGFTGYTGRGGMRADGDDISIVVSDRPTTSAAMFTRSRFAAPSVRLSRRHTAARRFRAVVTLAQNANVATGRRGEENTAEVVRRTAALLGVAEEEVLIGATGVIGRPLPMETIRAHFDALPAPAPAGGAAGAAGGVGGRFTADPEAVARAMMTTDTRPKTHTRTVGPARITAVAKGVGMLEPNMATMLAYLFTDAAVEPEELDRALRAAVDRSFNCLSVDTDTSTSDTVAVLANGAAGPVDPGEFAAALADVCLDLTLQMARDGEGATKLLTVSVDGARDGAQARRVAKAVVNSPLVKTAVHGADPNWGRVLMAVGKNTEETDIDPERVVVRFGDLPVYPEEPEGTLLEEVTALLRRDEVTIRVSLGIADGAATVYGCDLSAGYVRVNADYTS